MIFYWKIRKNCGWNNCWKYNYGSQNIIQSESLLLKRYSPNTFLADFIRLRLIVILVLLSRINSFPFISLICSIFTKMPRLHTKKFSLFSNSFVKSENVLRTIFSELSVQKICMQCLKCSAYKMSHNLIRKLSPWDESWIYFSLWGIFCDISSSSISSSLLLYGFTR